MILGAPTSHQAVREQERRQLRLAQRVRVQVPARQVLVGGLDDLPQGAHAQPGVLVARAPQHIVVAEKDRGAFVVGEGAGAEAAALGCEYVHNDL